MGQLDVENRRHPRRRRDLRGDAFAGPGKPPSRPMMETDPPPPAGYDLEQRNFFDRIGDEVRSWFGDEEAERRREYDELMHHSYAESHRLGFAPPPSGSGASRGFSPYLTYPQSGFLSSRPPATQVEHDRHYDLEYQVWRERQMKALDKEYEEYCQERQQRFDENFNGWREKRTVQRTSLGSVKEHMAVVGSDGESVGTVDCIRGTRIVLTRGDADSGGVHHSIPCRWIDRVEDMVVLEVPAEQAKTQWRVEPTSKPASS